jgi:hypothetical protein
MKKCLSCSAAKPLSEFNKDVRRGDGHGVYCRPCNKILQERYYEKHHGSMHPLKKLRTQPSLFRFRASFTPHPISGCWLWRGRPQGSNGYGRIKHNGVAMQAHRFSWLIHHGEIPPRMLVRHKCDTPLCVNPSHLLLGSAQENSDDKLSRGRQYKGAQASAARRLTAQRGISHPRAKLTDVQVLAIRKDKRPQRFVAADYGVSQCLVHNIVSRKAWSHI